MEKIVKPIPLIVRTPPPPGSTISDSKFSLFRNVIKYINKTDPTASRTPACVIAEIADCHNISLKPDGTISSIHDIVESVLENQDNAIEIIETASSEDFFKKIPELVHPNIQTTTHLTYPVSELEKVALYINSDETKWSDVNLFQAFKTTAKFEDLYVKTGILENTTASASPENFENLILSMGNTINKFGRKTSENPTCVDLLTVYSALTICGGGITENMTRYTTVNDIQCAFILTCGDLISTTSSGPSSEISSIISSYLGTLLLTPSYLSISTRAAFTNAMLSLSKRDPENTFYDSRSGNIKSIRVLPCSSPTSKINNDDIYAEFESLSKLTPNALSKTVPTSEIEAVVITMMLFSLDVSKATLPSAELAELKLCRIVDVYNSGEQVLISSLCDLNDISKFTPRDPDFAQRFYSSPLSFDTNYTWSETLSPCYSKSRLSKILKDNGFSLIKNSSSSFVWTTNESPAASACGDELASKLALSAGDIRFTNTDDALYYLKDMNSFIIGYSANCCNTKSPISLADFSNSEDTSQGWFDIVSFGNNKTSTAYLVSDIANQFDKTCKFEIPVVDANSSRDCYILTVRNILQLKILTKRILSENGIRFMDGGGSKNLESWINLDNSIRKVESHSLMLSEYGGIIRGYVNSETPENVLKFKNILTLLTELAWYMRAWKVSEKTNIEGVYPLPLSSESTCFDTELEPLVCLNVTNAISRFEEAVAVDDNFEGGTLILKAPLLLLSTACIREGKKVTREIPPQFVPVVNISNLFGGDTEMTITEQLKIIKEGETLSSCVRTSSNYIAASAFFYSVAAGFDPCFDIREVDQIF